jgi:plasmid maintenance system antidote protein VapI
MLLKKRILCKMKDTHIGKLIGLRIEQTGMSKAEFARRINRSPQNIQDLLTRSSVDTALLIVISQALGYNFFKAFINHGEALSELKQKGLNGSSHNGDGLADLQKTLDQIAQEHERLKAEIVKLKKRK